MSGPAVDVTCGKSVRRSSAAFFEGTWSGGSTLACISEATTVFGSGMAVQGGELVAVPPSHTHEGLYAVRTGTSAHFSNSLVALLVATGASLDPSVPYPTLFCQVAHLKVAGEDQRTGLLPNSVMTIPTRSAPVMAFYIENVHVALKGDLAQVAKPREPAFTSFDDYRARLVGATRSLIANGSGYEAIVALSTGYDSTAVAAVASQLGCRRALTLTSGRSFVDGSTISDSGAATADVLGLTCEEFERLAYRRRTDPIEAEFLASGMSGEDVVFAAFEARLKRKILFTGFWSGDLWVKSKHYPQPWVPGDFSGCTLSEFRLRTDFIHVPLPCFAAYQPRDDHPFVTAADMRPYSVGGAYDRAIPRRLAEEGGVPRDSFAKTKQASTMLLHRTGRDAFAPATVTAIEQFARAEGSLATFARQRRPRRSSRAAIRIAYALRAPRLVSRLERRRQLAVTFDAEFGSLLFRWAASIVRPRYGILEPRR